MTAILALGLFSCHPLFAQAPLSLKLQTSEENGEPISFMRPHYVIHVDKAGRSAGPPSTAYSPSQVRHAYGFDQVSNQGAGQVIGIVDAYDDPNIESDLGVFNRQFGLPACTTNNGCFRKVYGKGRKPAANANWGIEIALDVEWAHAIAPQAKIVLVEAPTNSLADLLAAVDSAVNNGASVVSMSWTAGEFSSELRLDNHFVTTGVTFLAASGDTGTGVVYPAASPFVVGVGGTSLYLDVNGNYLNETAWSGSGGGLSVYEHEPLYQALFGMNADPRGLRGAPDVSYNANPGTGYSVYDSFGFGGSSGWFQVGGTSAGTPQWAALIAIANSMRTAVRKSHLSSTNSSLYTIAQQNLSSDFNPVTQGTNGSCGAWCSATPGYDYVTGLGTPQAGAMISALVDR
ncbi:MAG: S53 family peptidase [Candidatus Acidiferrales bacterium]